MEAHSLISLAAEEISAALSDSNGRSIRTIHGGRDRALRQTIVALAAGYGLSEHLTPGEATLEVLTGHVRVTTAEESWDGWMGDYLILPASRHGLDALEDSAVLLTLVATVKAGGSA